MTIGYIYDGLLKYRIDVFMKTKNIKSASKELGIADISLRQYFSNNGFNYKLYTSKGKYFYTTETFLNDKEFYYYFLGFVCADGSIKETGPNKKRTQVTIELQSRDVELLELFKNKICPEKPICDVKNRNSKYITFNNEFFHEYFMLHNITKNKTATLNPKNIENEYFRHFLRGVFDGDGSICVDKNGYEDVSILGTKELIDLILEKTKDCNFGWKVYHIENKNNNNFYNLRLFNTEGVHFFKQYIYKNSSYYLQRKKDKFKA